MAISEDSKVVGTFFIKENQPDLGSHVAHAGYMIAPMAEKRWNWKADGRIFLQGKQGLIFS